MIKYFKKLILKNVKSGKKHRHSFFLKIKIQKNEKKASMTL